MRGYKVKYPREGEERDFQRWLSEYEAVSRDFTVCKLIEEMGTSQYVNDVVRLHDEITGVGYPQRLA